MHIYYFLLLFLMAFYIANPAKMDADKDICEVDEFNKNDLRETFFMASYNEEAFIRLEECLQEQSFLDSVNYNGYDGALKVLRARYEGGIFKKLNYVSNGTNLLDTAIHTAPENIELRFLRFAVAFHLPSLLQNKQILKKDKRYIIEHVNQARKLNLSETFKTKLLGFMKETGCFSENELTQFENEMGTFT